MVGPVSEDEADGARSLEKARVQVAARLRARSPEIERAIYVRIRDAVPDPCNDDDVAYQAGVHATIAGVVSYSIDGIEHGPDWPGPLPEAAVAQTRRAVRAGISLGALLRRYLAGHRRLGEFVAEEVERSGALAQGPALRHLRRAQDTLLEKVSAAIELEYNAERRQLARPPEERRADLVGRLLAAEPADPRELAELDYDLYGSWHVGVIATGVDAKEALSHIQADLDCEVLSVARGDATIVGWLGSRRRPAAVDDGHLAVAGHLKASLAIGEPGRGIDGWRLSHHQSRAAFGVAVRKPQSLTRYSDVMLLAATLQCDTLAQSLRTMFLQPLGAEGDRQGRERRETLRAYIDARCNITSAAFPLRVGRHTVENRVRAIERLLGRQLRTCLAELDVALRLEELDGTPTALPAPAHRLNADTSQCG